MEWQLGKNWTSTETRGYTETTANEGCMNGQVINIVPLLLARRIARQLLSRMGTAFFTLEEKRGPAFRLDPSKLDLVVELARRDTRVVAPEVPPSNGDLDTCRRHLRREMIQEVIAGAV